MRVSCFFIIESVVYWIGFYTLMYQCGVVVWCGVTQEWSRFVGDYQALYKQLEVVESSIPAVGLVEETEERLSERIALYQVLITFCSAPRKSNALFSLLLCVLDYTLNTLRPRCAAVSEEHSGGAPAAALPGPRGREETVAECVLLRARGSAHSARRTLAQQHYQNQQRATAPRLHAQTLDQVSLLYSALYSALQSLLFTVSSCHCTRYYYFTLYRIITLLSYYVTVTDPGVSSLYSLVYYYLTVVFTKLYCYFTLLSSCVHYVIITLLFNL